jgi:hypothetical protein
VPIGCGLELSKSRRDCVYELQIHEVAACLSKLFEIDLLFWDMFDPGVVSCSLDIFVHHDHLADGH